MTTIEFDLQEVGMHPAKELKDIAIRMARGEKIPTQPAPPKRWTDDKSWGVGDGPLKSYRNPWT